MDNHEKTDEADTALHASPPAKQIVNKAARHQPVEAILHASSTEPGILFFDEADSLFGKRSKVKDSHKK